MEPVEDGPGPQNVKYIYGSSLYLVGMVLHGLIIYRNILMIEDIGEKP
jgi:hypothetical protein